MSYLGLAFCPGLTQPANDADLRRQFPPWGADEAAGNRTSGIIPSIEMGCWTEEAKLRHQGRGFYEKMRALWPPAFGGSSTLMEKRSFITLKYLQQSKCYISALEGTSRKAWSLAIRGLGCREADSRKCRTPARRVSSGTRQDVTL
ncbi:hypothetical protein R6Z07M_011133 [Ovis aries]